MGMIMLFAPATHEGLLWKVNGSRVTHVVLDLEDSVGDEFKRDNRDRLLNHKLK